MEGILKWTGEGKFIASLKSRICDDAVEGHGPDTLDRSSSTWSKANLQHHPSIPIRKGDDRR